MIADIMLGFLCFTVLFFIWVFAFFIFDTEVLNGYFKQKLQNRFKNEIL